MPTPNKNETKEDFIERCMSDGEAKKDFPDDKQRLAFCYSQWEEGRNMKDRETRNINVELRVKSDDDDSGKIVGYAAVFNKLSEDLGGFREKIQKGAFKNTLNADVRALFDHDSKYVLGRTTSGTLNMKEDKNGLNVEIDPPDTSWAKDLTASINRGDINQMSFGFRTLVDEWDESDPQNPIRTLKDVELFDVSVVTYPAYPDTSVALRSLKDIKSKDGLDAETSAKEVKPETDDTLDVEISADESKRGGEGNKPFPFNVKKKKLDLLTKTIKE